MFLPRFLPPPPHPPQPLSPPLPSPPYAAVSPYRHPTSDITATNTKREMSTLKARHPWPHAENPRAGQVRTEAKKQQTRAEAARQLQLQRRRQQGDSIGVPLDLSFSTCLSTPCARDGPPRATDKKGHNNTLRKAKDTSQPLHISTIQYIDTLANENKNPLGVTLKQNKKNVPARRYYYMVHPMATT